MSGPFSSKICKFCKWEIEPCLERKTGWKHCSPWFPIDCRCGGKAEPEDAI